MASYDGKLLVLDGGGIRCLGEGVLLKELPKINYDVISGTSGGAINSCLLALGYTADDIIEFYTGECGKKIFKKYTLPIHKSLYDAKNINNVLLDKMGNAKLKDIKNIKLVIPSYDIISRKLILFNNVEDQYKNLYLRDIARSSSAAPLYFTPHEFEGYRCIDGEVITTG